MGTIYHGWLESIYGGSIINGNEKTIKLLDVLDKGFFFHCLRISNISSRVCFIDLRRCLHLTNSRTYGNLESGAPRYGKLHQTQWLLNAIQDRCKALWNLDKNMTIDEMMICYKGTYCSIRQYMPKKLEKWGLKV